jgi:hypothetical protein
MKRIILTSVFLVGILSAKGQISITADSVITCRSDERKEAFIPVSRQAEKFSLEIDKDLLTLRVFGTGHEHALIEKAYIVDLLELDDKKLKWIFQAEDKNCISYTITLDLTKKNISFLTFGKETGDNRTLSMYYYPIVDIKINKEAIDAHLKEKGTKKY